MATYLQLVNSVLRRLRESEVASISATEYSTLIGDFVNEAKQDVEESWTWTVLRTDIDITLDNTQAAGTPYSMTGAGERWTFYDTPNFCVYNENGGDGYWLKEMTTNQVKTLALNNTTNGNTGEVSYYYIQGQDSSGDSYIYFDKKTDANDTVSLRLAVPQVDLSSETDVIKVPSNPVVLGAYARALEERGEDMGKLTDRAVLNYEKALQTAIARDATRTVGETTWYGR
jgi:hypothetical protein